MLLYQRVFKYKLMYHLFIMSALDPQTAVHWESTRNKNIQKHEMKFDELTIEVPPDYIHGLFSCEVDIH